MKHNIFSTTKEEHFEIIKRNQSYGIFFFIFFPIGFVIIAIGKMLGAGEHTPKPVAIILGILAMFFILSPIKKQLDSISLLEIEEEDIAVQKKLRLQYYWVLLVLIATPWIMIYLLRLLYFSFK
jgi:hypothetical protein